MNPHRSNRRCALGVGVVLATGSVVQAQSLVHAVPGTAAGESYGTAVALVGDVDGDGRADFAGTSTTAAQNRGVVRLHSGADAALVWEVQGPIAGQRFGASLARLGDLDGDGRDDLLVGAWSASFTGALQAGAARVLSGASGATIREHRGDAAQDHFGWTVAGLGDLDADGVLDYAVGAVDDDDNGGSSGTVRVFSGASGVTLYTLRGAAAEDLFGTAIARVPDADGDGVDDMAVGAPSFASNLRPGYVRLHSGRTGALLWTVLGSANQDQFGGAVAGLGDLDGDGRGEVLVGARQLQIGATGYARVLSGADGSVLREFQGPAAGARFGATVAAAGDVDYDGIPDLWIGAPESSATGLRAGRVEAYSGASGALLARFEGVAANARLGSALDAGPDVTGEGGPDLAAGAPGEAVPGTNAGALRVFRGSELAPPPPPEPGPRDSLEADRLVVSWSARDVQRLDLQAPAEHAGRLWRMLGSGSGTSPGFHVLGLHVPLNRDRYLLGLAVAPGCTPLDPAFGRLDETGRAVSAFRLDRRHRPWIGRTFHHAYVVLDERCRPRFASVPVAVTIAP
ncbi:MAG: FG-GAP repeat protein [Planctomycetes bacterium]|nr:FG-GAP repeat protein [Planctomycetota bacterium]